MNSQGLGDGIEGDHAPPAPWQHNQDTEDTDDPWGRHGGEPRAQGGGNTNGQKILNQVHFLSQTAQDYLDDQPVEKRVAGLEESARGDFGQKKRWPGKNKESHMRAAWQGLDAPGYSTGDTEGDAAQAKRARVADVQPFGIEGDVPEVSGGYDLTSAELSYSGIVYHKQNKIGLVVILRVIEELRGGAPRRACLRSCVFGGCSVAQCDYDHDNAPLTDEQRLQVLRRARDLVLAGKATSGV